MAARLSASRLDLVGAYRGMLTIRRFEERVLELRLALSIDSRAHRAKRRGRAGARQG